MLPHLLMRFSGVFFNGDQTWSFGLRFRDGTGGDPGGGIGGIDQKLETWVDAVRELNTRAILPDDFLRFMSSGAQINGLRASRIEADGKESAVAQIQLATGIAGQTSVRLPSQVAVCLSLRTYKPGASYRGRLYLPALGAQLAPTGRISSSDAQALATAGAGFITAVQDAGAGFTTPALSACVVSTKKDIATEITQVHVGDRLDIQRRRADKETEAYSVASVAQ